MDILVTGASGYVGGALIPRLLEAGHGVRAFARDPVRVRARVPVVRGDAITGAGLDEALRGIDVAYYLIHSMESGPPSPDGFQARDRQAAERFAAAAVDAGVGRIVYLGGLIGTSPHLASRVEVEASLLGAVPDSVALRASIIVGAHSRSFGRSDEQRQGCPVVGQTLGRRLTERRATLSTLVAHSSFDVTLPPAAMRHRPFESPPRSLRRCCERERT